MITMLLCISRQSSPMIEALQQIGNVQDKPDGTAQSVEPQEVFGR